MRNDPKSQPAPPQEARKTVTVLFCDLVGSTALGESLDSESLREVMDRYFAAMKRIVERHGGIVEKYIGDAVMVVFGLPRAHEDDALRAVRAAFEMGQSLGTLNTELDRYWGVVLANRIGVNTGEVVVGDPTSGQRLATGDAVNVAARLEQAAPTNHVLIGEPTYRLVRNAVSVDAVETLALKGKSEPLPAYRLIEVRGREGVARHLDAPLVAREEELSSLLDAFERVAEDHTCQLTTVLGEAGVGKSRLVAEVAGRLQQRACVLIGRCLSYGEGITFWPLAEIIRQAGAITDEDSPDLARQKLTDLVLDQGEGIADRVASVVGLSSAPFPIEEAFWATRKLLEGLARDQPLVIVLEDIHWAEPTFLDWIEHVVDLADAPILVVCAARLELLEERAAWSESSGKATVVNLRPLSGEETEALIVNLLGPAGASEVSASISATAQGNPLFVEQIVSMWIDDGTLRRDDGRWFLARDASAVTIPATISALLSARLDRLAHEERTVIAGASVVGQVFYRGAVEELCPAVMKPQVPTSLSALMAKQFVRPDQSMFANERAFAFRHVLIRDAAYEAILKRTRAELHERFASWLERITSDRIAEYEDLVGHHLEQAYRYRQSLQLVKDHSNTLAKRASARLSSAGRRAAGRGDVGAAINLLMRATGLLPREDRGRVEIMADLGHLLADAGRGEQAEKILDEAVVVAAALEDHRLEARAKLERTFARAYAGLVAPTEAERRHAESALVVFRQAHDELGLSKAWLVLGMFFWWRGRAADAGPAYRRALEHARRAGDRKETGGLLGAVAVTVAWGPLPVTDGVPLLVDILEQVKGNAVGEPRVLRALAVMEGMRGDFERAWSLLERSDAIMIDFGMEFERAAASWETAYVDELAGKSQRAEARLRQARRVLQEMGTARENLVSIELSLAETLCNQGRFQVAAELIEGVPKPPDGFSFDLAIEWRRIRARLLAYKGQTEAADALMLEPSVSSSRLIALTTMPVC